MSDEPKTLEQRVAVLEQIVARLTQRAKDDDAGLEAMFTASKR